MVAINNNFVGKFKILDSELSSEKTSELFAELFALMNLGSLDLEEKNSIKENIFQPSDEKNNNQIDIFEKVVANSKQIKDIPKNQPNELEVTKSLVEIFYKEIGILESPNSTKPAQKNELISFKDLKNIKISNVLKIAENNNLNKNSDELRENSDQNKTQSFVINIVKKPSNLKKSLKIGDNIKFEKNNEILNESSIENVTTKSNKKIFNNLNQETNLVNKKLNKKSKQFSFNKKEKSENLILQNKTNVIQPKIYNNQIINNLNRDNQINQKKEINERNDFKVNDTKPPGLNTNGKEFLNLLESSWGEKFSRIIKNTVNNGLNKLEIELKPKNLGKLNLEVSVKNNSTSINIGSENQEVVSLLNENLPKLIDTIDKESKSLSSLANGDGNQNNYFNEKKNKNDFFSNGQTSRKKEKVEGNNSKISNHNIDVNA